MSRGMSYLAEEKGRCSKQRCVICKDAETIERMADSGNCEKSNITRLGKVKRYRSAQTT
jgi:hypothetical protein